MKLLRSVHCWGIEQAERVGSSATRTAGTSGKVSTSVCRMRSSLTGPSGACTTRAGGGHHQIHMYATLHHHRARLLLASSSAVLLTDCYMCRRPNDVTCCWVQYISPPSHPPLRFSIHSQHMYTAVYRDFSLFCQGLRQGQGRACWCTGAQPWTESPSQLSAAAGRHMCIIYDKAIKRSARDKP